MRFGRDLQSLMRKLLRGYYLYFHNDVLNSDGRRLFEEILRMLMYEHPEYRRLVYRVRRNPDLDNVIRVARLFLDEDEIHKLLDTSINGFYIYKKYSR